MKPLSLSEPMIGAEARFDKNVDAYEGTVIVHAKTKAEAERALGDVLTRAGIQPYAIYADTWHHGGSKSSFSWLPKHCQRMGQAIAKFRHADLERVKKLQKEAHWGHVTKKKISDRELSDLSMANKPLDCPRLEDWREAARELRRGHDEPDVLAWFHGDYDPAKEVTNRAFQLMAKENVRRAALPRK